MKYLKLYLVFFVLVSCDNFTSSQADISPNTEIPKDLLITFSRTGCFAAANACPTYDLSINADGSVVYDGKEVVKTLGKVKDKISEKQLFELIDEFQKADFFILDDSYDYKNCPSSASDSPAANTSIQMNGRKKTVRHDLGCYSKYPEVYPPKLFELENRIDEIVGTKRWTGEKE